MGKNDPRNQLVLIGPGNLKIVLDKESGNHFFKPHHTSMYPL